MFSGKTDELITEYRRVVRDGGSAVAVKPAIDTRHPTDKIVSHSGQRMPAVAVAGSSQVSTVGWGSDYVFIDEVQFFDSKLADAVANLRAAGRHVIAAGLDLDFRRVPFETTAVLTQIASRLVQLSARCDTCGRPASVTQRLVEGFPAALDEPTIRIGDTELYEPRCVQCWERERVSLHLDRGSLLTPLK
jgi:thymidine kinase